MNAKISACIHRFRHYCDVKSNNSHKFCKVSRIHIQDEEYLISNSKEDPSSREKKEDPSLLPWFLESKYTKLKTERRLVSQVLLFILCFVKGTINFSVLL